MTADLPRVFYRIVRAETPTLWDIMSNEERGRRPRRPLDAAGWRMWRGVSVFDTLEGARQAVRRTPALGAFVARIEIPPNAALQVEQTGRAGHYTLWGEAADLLQWVVAIESV